jgi:hypothetical protein
MEVALIIKLKRRTVGPGGAGFSSDSSPACFGADVKTVRLGARNE